ncbi:UNVERIFIED_CONTAM: hypothetical protein PYX00_011120 [Menopon gallinae]|uniref:Uncharacterized protein n=1 Tax=Menopon gallinae TaxID=328185 RepID=A0AAW2H661_9NEOP
MLYRGITNKLEDLTNHIATMGSVIVKTHERQERMLRVILKDHELIEQFWKRFLLGEEGMMGIVNTITDRLAVVLPESIRKVFAPVLENMLDIMDNNSAMLERALEVAKDGVGVQQNIANISGEAARTLEENAALLNRANEELMCINDKLRLDQIASLIVSGNNIKQELVELVDNGNAMLDEANNLARDNNEINIEGNNLKQNLIASVDNNTGAVEEVISSLSNTNAIVVDIKAINEQACMAAEHNNVLTQDVLNAQLLSNEVVKDISNSVQVSNAISSDTLLLLGNMLEEGNSLARAILGGVTEIVQHNENIVRILDERFGMIIALSSDLLASSGAMVALLDSLNVSLINHYQNTAAGLGRANEELVHISSLTSNGLMLLDASVNHSNAIIQRLDAELSAKTSGLMDINQKSSDVILDISKQLAETVQDQKNHVSISEEVKQILINSDGNLSGIGNILNTVKDNGEAASNKLDKLIELGNNNEQYNKQSISSGEKLESTLSQVVNLINNLGVVYEKYADIVKEGLNEVIAGINSVFNVNTNVSNTIDEIKKLSQNIEQDSCGKANNSALLELNDKLNKMLTIKEDVLKEFENSLMPIISGFEQNFSSVAEKVSSLNEIAQINKGILDSIDNKANNALKDQLNTINTSILNLDKAFKELNSYVGTINKLFDTQKETINNINEGVKDIRVLVQDFSSIPQVLKDTAAGVSSIGAVIRSLEQTSENMNSSFVRISNNLSEEIKGLANVFIQLDDTFKLELNKLGQGTGEVYNNITRLIQQVIQLGGDVRSHKESNSLHNESLIKEINTSFENISNSISEIKGTLSTTISSRITNELTKISGNQQEIAYRVEQMLPYINELIRLVEGMGDLGINKDLNKIIDILEKVVSTDTGNKNKLDLLIKAADTLVAEMLNSRNVSQAILDIIAELGLIMSLKHTEVDDKELELETWPAFVDILSSTVVVLAFAFFILVVVLSLLKVTSSDTDAKNEKDGGSAVTIESVLLSEKTSEFQKLSIIAPPALAKNQTSKKNTPSSSEENRVVFVPENAKVTNDEVKATEIGESKKEVLGEIPKFTDSRVMEVLKELLIVQQDVIAQQRKVIEQQDTKIKQTAREYQSLLSIMTKANEVEDLRQQINNKPDKANFNTIDDEGERISGPVENPNALLYASTSYALTVNEVVEKVVNSAPELKIILEKREQAIANYKGSKALYLPSIYLDYIRKYEKADPLNNPSVNNWTGTNKFQLVLEQKIFDMNALASIARSSYMVQSQEFENQKLLESLILLAITSYFDIIQAEYVAAVNKEYLVEVSDIEKLVYKMRTQASANLDKVKLRLAYLLNIVTQGTEDSLSPSKLLPELSNKDFYDLADKMVSFLPITVNELQKEAIRNNVDILLIRSNLCAAGYRLEEQKAKYLPTIGATITLKDEEQKADNSIARTVYARPEDIIKLGFDLKNVKVTFVNGDVDLIFANGSVISLASFATLAFENNAPKIYDNEANRDKYQLVQNDEQINKVIMATVHAGELEGGNPISGVGEVSNPTSGLPSSIIDKTGNVVMRNLKNGIGDYLSTHYTTHLKGTSEEENILPGSKDVNIGGDQVPILYFGSSNNTIRYDLDASKIDSIIVDADSLKVKKNNASEDQFSADETVGSIRFIGSKGSFDPTNSEEVAKINGIDIDGGGGKNIIQFTSVNIKNLDKNTFALTFDVEKKSMLFMSKAYEKITFNDHDKANFSLDGGAGINVLDFSNWGAALGGSTKEGEGSSAFELKNTGVVQTQGDSPESIKYSWKNIQSFKGTKFSDSFVIKDEQTMYILDGNKDSQGDGNTLDYSFLGGKRGVALNISTGTVEKGDDIVKFSSFDTHALDSLKSIDGGGGNNTVDYSQTNKDIEATIVKSGFDIKGGEKVTDESNEAKVYLFGHGAPLSGKVSVLDLTQISNVNFWNIAKEDNPASESDIGSKKDDTFFVSDVDKIANNIMFDGNGGENTLNFIASSKGITIDISLEKIKVGDKDLNIARVSKLVLSNHDDTVKITKDNANLLFDKINGSMVQVDFNQSTASKGDKEDKFTGINYFYGSDSSTGFFLSKELKGENAVFSTIYINKAIDGVKVKDDNNDVISISKSGDGAKLLVSDRVIEGSRIKYEWYKVGTIAFTNNQTVVASFDEQYNYNWVPVTENTKVENTTLIFDNTKSLNKGGYENGFVVVDVTSFTAATYTANSDPSKNSPIAKVHFNGVTTVVGTGNEKDLFYGGAYNIKFMGGEKSGKATLSYEKYAAQAGITVTFDTENGAKIEDSIIKTKVDTAQHISKFVGTTEDDTFIIANNKGRGKILIDGNGGVYNKVDYSNIAKGTGIILNTEETFQGSLTNKGFAKKDDEKGIASIIIDGGGGENTIDYSRVKGIDADGGGGINSVSFEEAWEGNVDIDSITGGVINVKGYKLSKFSKIILTKNNDNIKLKADSNIDIDGGGGTNSVDYNPSEKDPKFTQGIFATEYSVLAAGNVEKIGVRVMKEARYTDSLIRFNKFIFAQDQSNHYTALFVNQVKDSPTQFILDFNRTDNADKKEVVNVIDYSRLQANTTGIGAKITFGSGNNGSKNNIAEVTRSKLHTSESISDLLIGINKIIGTNKGDVFAISTAVKNLVIDAGNSNTGGVAEKNGLGVTFVVNTPKLVVDMSHFSDYKVYLQTGEVFQNNVSVGYGFYMGFNTVKPSYYDNVAYATIANKDLLLYKSSKIIVPSSGINLEITSEWLKGAVQASKSFTITDGIVIDANSAPSKGINIAFNNNVNNEFKVRIGDDNVKVNFINVGEFIGAQNISSSFVVTKSGTLALEGSPNADEEEATTEKAEADKKEDELNNNSSEDASYSQATKEEDDELLNVVENTEYTNVVSSIKPQEILEFSSNDDINNISSEALENLEQETNNHQDDAKEDILDVINELQSLSPLQEENNQAIESIVNSNSLSNDASTKIEESINKHNSMSGDNHR